MICALICSLLYMRKKIRIINAVFTVLLCTYICFVLSVTLIERITTPDAHYMSKAFWSYELILQGSTGLLIENLLNVLLFIPVGVLVSALVRTRRIFTAFFFGTALSSVIELIQLFSHRGLFEYDDIVHNTMGSFLGGIITMVLSALIRRIQNKEGRNGQ